jgi:hypothetical protein
VLSEGEAPRAALFGLDVRAGVLVAHVLRLALWLRALLLRLLDLDVDLLRALRGKLLGRLGDPLHPLAAELKGLHLGRAGGPPGQRLRVDKVRVVVVLLGGREAARHLAGARVRSRANLSTASANSLC